MRHNSFANYQYIGRHAVHGYTRPQAFELLKITDAAQRCAGVGGPVAEIGVHHGALFIAMKLLQQAGESALAIDLFDQQEDNIDGSGCGDLARFRANVARWSTLDDLVIHQGNSTYLDPNTVRALAGGPIRLFSVDGGHTEDVVLSDMRLAENSLAPEGIVIADDVFHQHWPGVAVGTIRYLERGRLVPFCIGFNKVLFAFPEYAPHYRSAIEVAYADRFLTAEVTSEFAGHKVVVLVPIPRQPAHLARRSATARRIYHQLMRIPRR